MEPIGPLVVIHDLEQGYRRRWVFEWRGREIILQRYHYEVSEGDSYKLVQFYDSGDAGGYGDWQWLSEDQVPWDDELKGEAALALMSKVRVRRPSET